MSKKIGIRELKKGDKLKCLTRDMRTGKDTGEQILTFEKMQDGYACLRTPQHEATKTRGTHYVEKLKGNAFYTFVKKTYDRH